MLQQPDKPEPVSQGAEENTPQHKEPHQTGQALRKGSLPPRIISEVCPSGYGPKASSSIKRIPLLLCISLLTGASSALTSHCSFPPTMLVSSKLDASLPLVNMLCSPSPRILLLVLSCSMGSPALSVSSGDLVSGSRVLPGQLWQ